GGRQLRATVATVTLSPSAVGGYWKWMRSSTTLFLLGLIHRSDLVVKGRRRQLGWGG
ncbi:hypothetical protein ACLOJK_024072, partial [Asimina triloba]